MMMFEEILAIILFIILVVLVSIALTGVKFVKEYHRVVVFRLGRLKGARGPGITYVIPFLEKGITIDIRTKTFEVPKQEVITTDNVPVSINAICYYRIKDPIQVIMKIKDVTESMFQLAQATTRSVVGQSELDEILSKRYKVNKRIQSILSDFIDDWGLEVETVEIKDVELPEGMKRAMARQAEAERNKRGRIIQAEGEKMAAKKLAEASKTLRNRPSALYLRTLQALQLIGAEKNATTILLTPTELLKALNSIGKLSDQLLPRTLQNELKTGGDT